MGDSGSGGQDAGGSGGSGVGFSDEPCGGTLGLRFARGGDGIWRGLRALALTTGGGVVVVATSARRTCCCGGGLHMMLAMWILPPYC